MEAPLIKVYLSHYSMTVDSYHTLFHLDKPLFIDFLRLLQFHSLPSYFVVPTHSIILVPNFQKNIIFALHPPLLY